MECSNPTAFRTKFAMSLTLKVGSLAITTLAKPIGVSPPCYLDPLGTIKITQWIPELHQKTAREHERFRKIGVNFAQRLHRMDMRMRLGLLQDSTARNLPAHLEQTANNNPVECYCTECITTIITTTITKTVITQMLFMVTIPAFHGNAHHE
jgi:hypothetical protein